MVRPPSLYVTAGTGAPCVCVTAQPREGSSTATTNTVTLQFTAVLLSALSVCSWGCIDCRGWRVMRFHDIAAARQLLRNTNEHNHPAGRSCAA